LELTLTEEDSAFLQSSSQARRQLLSVLCLRRGEAKGINSVGTGEECSVGWVLLDVLPSGVGPSAWDELEVLLRNSDIGLGCLGAKDLPAQADRSTSGLVSSTVVENIVSLAVTAVLHCCLQIYKLY